MGAVAGEVVARVQEQLELWEFELDVPSEALTAALGRLVTAGATPGPADIGPARARITGTIPTENVNAFEQRLPGLTSGRGVFIAELAGYEPVAGPPPTRGTRP